MIRIPDATFLLSDVKNPVFSSGRTGDAPLRPGDMLLVQVSREAMKGKLPAVTNESEFYRQISGSYYRGEKDWFFQKTDSGREK